MPAISAPAKVLVTGASGYIAAWVVKDLLDQGYVVRGTVRSLKRAEHFDRLFSSAAKERRLEFFEVPDIKEDGAFDEAVKDVDAILHVASPASTKADDPNEVIVPAVNGTVGILKSATKYGKRVKRIGITSSTAAISDEVNETGILNEKNWNDASVADVRKNGRAASGFSKYRASKVLAEKAAWEYVDEHKGEIEWDVVTFCPPWVFGPVVHEVASLQVLGSSMDVFYNKVFASKGKPEQDYSGGSSWVDVRDVARSHIRALEIPEAGGKRFIISAGEFSWKNWLDVVNELAVPGFGAAVGTPGTGEKYKPKFQFDGSKAVTILGMRYREKVETARDIIEDFQSRGWKA